MSDVGVTFYKGDENTTGSSGDLMHGYETFGSRVPAERSGAKTTDFVSVDTQDGTPSRAFDASNPILPGKHPVPQPTKDVLVSPMDK